MEHRKRPPVARTAPIRSWSQLLNRPTPATEPPPSGAGADAAEPDPAVADVIGRSVDLAYRVIDDYIQQGQRAAARAARGAYGPAAFTADMQDWSAGMLRYASEFAEVWMGFASRAAATAQPAPAPTPAGPTPVTPPSPAARPGAVTIEIVAARPTQVSLDIAPESHDKPLVVRPLRGMTPTAPPIADVVFVPATADQPARLTLRVPPDQPPGAYHGIVLDADRNLPVGALMVRIADG